MRHDKQQYLTIGRQRIQALEQILRDETEGPSEDHDAGWDADSLRQEYGDGVSASEGPQDGGLTAARRIEHALAHPEL
jgi:hypothetical protein